MTSASRPSGMPSSPRSPPRLASALPQSQSSRLVGRSRHAHHPHQLHLHFRRTHHLRRQQRHRRQHRPRLPRLRQAYSRLPSASARQQAGGSSNPTRRRCLKSCGTSSQSISRATQMVQSRSTSPTRRQPPLSEATAPQSLHRCGLRLGCSSTRSRPSTAPPLASPSRLIALSRRRQPSLRPRRCRRRYRGTAAPSAGTMSPSGVCRSFSHPRAPPAPEGPLELGFSSIAPHANARHADTLALHTAQLSHIRVRRRGLLNRVSAHRDLD